jgi:general secretion pathway protein A
MYNQFFDFKERPFKLVPNPEYLYLSSIHEEVLAHLNYAVGYGEGFVEITGEVGTGKTTLCRMFLENLDENTEAAYIFNPKLDVLQLLKAINDEFGLPSTDTESIKDLIDRLNAFLLDKKAQGKRVILLVDEAQNLTADVLEQLRLLSNLETTTSKLLQIILVGQPELGELLETRALRQLNQRITLSCHLLPLSLPETREYIRHRIHIASRKPGLAFSPAAYRSIFKYAGGTPRLINIACDRALLTAYTQGKRHISNAIVKKALRELDGKNRRRRHPPRAHRNKLIMAALAVLLILATGLFINRTAVKRIGGATLSPVAESKIAAPAVPSPPPISIETANAQPSEATVPPSAQQPTIVPATAQLPAAQLPAAQPPAAQPPATQPPATQPLTAEPAETQPSPIESTSPAAASVSNADLSPPPVVMTFDQAIDSADPVHSRLGALKAVLKQWGVVNPLNAQGADPVDGTDSDTYFRISANHNGLDALRVKGNLNIIKKLNLPAILEFPPPGGGATRFMAVVGINNDRFQLSDGKTTFAVAPTTLAGMWNGVAHVFWKNFFNYQGVIPISSPGEAIISLKIHLKALGFPIREMTAAYDTDTRMAIQEIQARHGLDADGKVGPLTKMVLYNEDKSLNIPRLAAVAEKG